MNTVYKVILVEDEIVTREGIRDNVKWNTHGFEFCGDASDGEIALSLLETSRPDLVITDIKMPFMDGLQLCKIIRERMPWVKVVIMSGHNEFNYAHAAINLGVKEYLLKPVTVEDIHQILDKMADQFNQERLQKEKLRQMQDQIEENQPLLRERFLMKIMIGALSSTEVVEQGKKLGLDLIAPCYQVALIKTGIADRSEQFDYDEYARVQQIILDVFSSQEDILALRKDWEEFLILIKGNSLQSLNALRDQALETIQKGINQTRYQIIVGIGAMKQRIAHIYQSYIEAMESLHNTIYESSDEVFDRDLLIKMDRSAVEKFLRCGIKEDAGQFFDSYLHALGEETIQSHLAHKYIFLDVYLAAARFINELDGNIDQALAEFINIDKTLQKIKTVEHLKQQVIHILSNAIEFRDQTASHQYLTVISQAKAYITKNYQNPDLSLNDVASHVNLSASHFSVIFSQENCQTFKEYLTEIRIQKARDLLRSTRLGANEISVQIGYNDPHYFSYVFKKKTGVSPTEYRQQASYGRNPS